MAAAAAKLCLNWLAINIFNIFQKYQMIPTIYHKKQNICLNMFIYTDLHIESHSDTQDIKLYPKTHQNTK